METETQETHEFSYDDLTPSDLDILIYHDCICDGDSKKIIIVEKED